MSANLDSALSQFLFLVSERFREAREKVMPQDGPRLLVSKEYLLAGLVERLEETAAFAAFVDATEKGESRERAKTFLRLSGVYQSLFDNAELPSTEVLRQYRNELEAESHKKVTYLAPLEFVKFGADLLDCRDFRIQRLCPQELDRLFRKASKHVFYKWAWINSSALADYWFIVVEKEGSRQAELEEMWSFVPERVQVEYSQFPAVVQSVVSPLALYDWSGCRPRIPFVIRCSESLVEPPVANPDLGVLAEEPYYDGRTGEELGVIRAQGLDLDESDTKQFQNFMQHITALVARCRRYRDTWGFVDTALGFLVKGFVERGGLEELLWNITTIEAVLGEKRKPPVTKLLLRRVSRIFGTDEREREQISARFKELYSFRSDLVHGNAELSKKAIYLDHLRESRKFARGAVLWMLVYLGHVVDHLSSVSGAVPKREELLQILDLDPVSRRHLVSLLPTRLADFPNVQAWTKPLYSE